MMRDTALYYPLRNLVGVRNEGVWPSLRKLAAAVLNEDMHAVGTSEKQKQKVDHSYLSLAASRLSIGCEVAGRFLLTATFVVRALMGRSHQYLFSFCTASTVVAFIIINALGILLLYC